ncbi:cell division FtsA domain-containing protein [Gracilibacillus marinus]|jgi:cell division protein FtsA|uniref:Cell division FtsA domain-containing protein n=1 Tax=Gracilibacillus marinus TaxID=630535 RepID=A0ABV8VUL6_9BACI
MSDRMFALDIGTRSVVGLLIEKIDETYRLIDYYVVEHDERSMLDGQIHDIVAVSNVIQRVKYHLEQKHHITLDSVCVAAAGRALKTKRVKTTKNIEKQPLMNEEDILFLELEAVQKAQYDLANEEKDSSSHYYCVGYSVLNYVLDDEIIGSLIDQQGTYATVEIIATFLPKVVVESLLSALTRADLKLEALTLEPIAAIQVLIPPSMRRLNVALVDIGAGTSDIALTSEGTVTAYGMVPKAGDEITEAISDHYLLDFNQAEQFKKDITTNNVAMIEDILGFEQEVTYRELVDIVLPSVDELAQAIADQLITLNGKPPKAVMLVGGGSQTPELSKRLAHKLKLPENRVAIRGVDAIQLLEKNEQLPIGPEFITPIGIAIAAKQNPVHYISVTVNERMIRLFEMKQLTMADVLLAAGLNIQKLYGKPGIAYIIQYNGKQLTLPGSFGTAPEIFINGQKASVDTMIQNGDTIQINKGTDGLSPEMSIEDLVGECDPFAIFLNEERKEIHPTILVNNKKQTANYIIQDGDNVEFRHTKKWGDLEEIKNKHHPFVLWIDDQKLEMNQYTHQLLVNGKEINMNDYVRNGDKCTIQVLQQPILEDIKSYFPYQWEKSIDIVYNNKPLKLSNQLIEVTRNGEALKWSDELFQYDKLQLKKLRDEPFIFQDIFRFISLDLSNTKGKIVTLKNKEPVSFFEQLKPNDHIEIYFD